MDADEIEDEGFCPKCGRESVSTGGLDAIITINAAGIRIEKLSKTTERVK